MLLFLINILPWKICIEWHIVSTLIFEKTGVYLHKQNCLRYFMILNHFLWIFSTISTGETIPVTSCKIFCMLSPFRNKSALKVENVLPNKSDLCWKRKNLLPLELTDPGNKGVTTFLWSCTPCQCIHFPLKSFVFFFYTPACLGRSGAYSVSPWCYVRMSRS